MVGNEVDQFRFDNFGYFSGYAWKGIKYHLVPAYSLTDGMDFAFNVYQTKACICLAWARIAQTIGS